MAQHKHDGKADRQVRLERHQAEADADGNVVAGEERGGAVGQEPRREEPVLSGPEVEGDDGQAGEEDRPGSRACDAAYAGDEEGEARTQEQRVGVDRREQRQRRQKKGVGRWIEEGQPQAAGHADRAFGGVHGREVVGVGEPAVAGEVARDHPRGEVRQEGKATASDARQERSQDVGRGQDAADEEGEATDVDKGA